MIGYLGPSGTFSHQAALEYTGGKKPMAEYPTIYSLIRAVDDGSLQQAIIPIENSIEGSVNVTLDTLALESEVYIVAEYILKVRENLLVKKGAKKEQIQEITSHPQPIGQCSRLLNREFEHVKITFSDSTAAAAKAVEAGDGSMACIGPAGLADLYDLDLLIPDCNDGDNNSTRFVVIAKQPCLTVTDHDKSSIAFALDNKPGCLFHALELIAASQINMLKIESRPMKDELGKYIFFIDIEGNIDQSTIYFALDKLRQSTSFYKFLGSYAQALK